MKQYNVACVIGTRPEALKMIPIIEEMQNHSQFNLKTIISGQHRELLQQMLKDSNINVDINFDVMQDNQSLNTLSANLLQHFERYIDENPTDLLIAQGDTTTTLVSALSAFYKNIPFAHVEAGLRTHSIQNPFPEEFNRRVTTLISTLHFCPTMHAAKNLQKEGITKHVYTVGNTIIDTLYKYAQPTAAPNHDQKMILVTCHRRENFGQPLQNICAALKKLATKNPAIEIIFPVHPNPNVRKLVYETLTGIDNIKLKEPMDYPEMVTMMSKAHLILTDSGGLQEEAPALKKPVLVLRNETERPEGVEIGVSRLVGDSTENIVQAVQALLHDSALYEKMSNAGSPYGDGKASKRIIEIIGSFLSNTPAVPVEAHQKATMLTGLLQAGP